MIERWNCAVCGDECLGAPAATIASGKVCGYCEPRVAPEPEPIGTELPFWFGGMA